VQDVTVNMQEVYDKSS